MDTGTHFGNRHAAERLSLVWHLNQVTVTEIGSRRHGITNDERAKVCARQFHERQPVLNEMAFAAGHVATVNGDQEEMFGLLNGLAFVLEMVFHAKQVASGHD
ncbi:hypothetical protein X744_15560 [Mesorhizobium sp. LNJC372A00]|nr:hypothetical protein X745_15845 [Mesorhizobium sp. LNJC374B00]ESY59502.1 hypothetical protein X744_15560 [Mesorhizobium sp. LNJC372A00]